MAGRRARSARPTRARSQHFLRTSGLAAELVRDACVGPNDVVVDLGAGTGRLTRELARAARRVVAVELDPRLAARLHGRWRNVDVVTGDATRVPLPLEPFRVVANVPFDQTTAILRRLLDDPRTPLVRADLVVEWGVAQKRALPWPSTLNGGPLGRVVRDERLAAAAANGVRPAAERRRRRARLRAPRSPARPRAGVAPLPRLRRHGLPPRRARGRRASDAPAAGRPGRRAARAGRVPVGGAVLEHHRSERRSLFNEIRGLRQMIRRAGRYFSAGGRRSGSTVRSMPQCATVKDRTQGTPASLLPKG